MAGNAYRIATENQIGEPPAYGRGKPRCRIWQRAARRKQMEKLYWYRLKHGNWISPYPKSMTEKEALCQTCFMMSKNINAQWIKYTNQNDKER